MNKDSRSSDATNGAGAQQLIAEVARHHDMPRVEAARLIELFQRRERQRGFGKGWWRELLDAQFVTHIGPNSRIRCGDETHLAHLTPEEGHLCHDCGCARGEYHVFGCDSEECSGCGGQAFCCDCPDGTTAAEAA